METAAHESPGFTVDCCDKVLAVDFHLEPDEPDSVCEADGFKLDEKQQPAPWQLHTLGASSATLLQVSGSSNCVQSIDFVLDSEGFSLEGDGVAARNQQDVVACTERQPGGRRLKKQLLPPQSLTPSEVNDWFMEYYRTAGAEVIVHTCHALGSAVLRALLSFGLSFSALCFACSLVHVARSLAQDNVRPGCSLSKLLVPGKQKIVLDLFCGCARVSAEVLSRGVCVCVC